MSSTSVSTDPSPDLADGRTDLAEEATRATLYHLLSRAFSSPLEMQEEHAEALSNLVTELQASIQKPADRLARAWTDALADREALTLAYARLFLGPFEILSPPYASMYLEPEQKLMGEVSRNIAREYAEAGLSPGSGPNEVPDHVALEWEFMYYLTYKYATTEDASWLAKRDRFQAEHMQTWLYKLSKLIADADEHEFYGELAEFMTGVLDNY